MLSSHGLFYSLLHAYICSIRSEADDSVQQRSLVISTSCRNFGPHAFFAYDLSLVGFLTTSQKANQKAIFSGSISLSSKLANKFFSLSLSECRVSLPLQPSYPQPTQQPGTQSLVFEVRIAISISRLRTTSIRTAGLRPARYWQGWVTRG